jgi:hypothetical protein
LLVLGVAGLFFWTSKSVSAWAVFVKTQKPHSPIWTIMDDAEIPSPPRLAAAEASGAVVTRSIVQRGQTCSLGGESRSCRIPIAVGNAGRDRRHPHRLQVYTPETGNASTRSRLQNRTSTFPKPPLNTSLKTLKIGLIGLIEAPDCGSCRYAGTAPRLGVRFCAVHSMQLALPPSLSGEVRG